MPPSQGVPPRGHQTGTAIVASSLPFFLDWPKLRKASSAVTRPLEFARWGAEPGKIISERRNAPSSLPGVEEPGRNVPTPRSLEPRTDRFGSSTIGLVRVIRRVPPLGRAMNGPPLDAFAVLAPWAFSGKASPGPAPGPPRPSVSFSPSRETRVPSTLRRFRLPPFRHPPQPRVVLLEVRIQGSCRAPLCRGPPRSPKSDSVPGYRGDSAPQGWAGELGERRSSRCLPAPAVPQRAHRARARWGAGNRGQSWVRHAVQHLSSGSVQPRSWAHPRQSTSVAFMGVSL